jgi:hypothetical protein
MAKHRNCKHQGFAYSKDGYKNVHIICDYDGLEHKKEYCISCENYVPRKKEGD